MAYVGVKPAGISSASQVETNLLNVDNVTIDGNTISSTDTNGDITLDPDGTGDVIVASGNVGIGTSSLTSKFEVAVSDSAAIQEAITIKGTQSGGYGGYLGWKDSWSGDSYTGYRGAIISDVPSADSGRMRFFTADSGSLSEAMRIDSSARLLVNTSSTLANGASAKLQVYGETGISVALQNDSAGQQTLGIWNKGDSGTRYFVWFESSSGRSAVGSITSDGSSTSYNTTSDHRLKEAVVDMTGAIDRVKALAPKRFNWIADPDDTTVDGFLAHEAQAVVPEAVTGTHNEVDEDGNAVMQGIDQSKLVPLLTGALKEAIAKIETLETQRADLEARLTALENA